MTSVKTTVGDAILFDEWVQIVRRTFDQIPDEHNPDTFSVTITFSGADIVCDTNATDISFNIPRDAISMINSYFLTHMSISLLKMISQSHPGSTDGKLVIRFHPDQDTLDYTLTYNEVEG